jgi:hypothetical protein
LRDSAKVTASKIEFPSTGATITAIASDYAGAAGANPTITVFDELWAYTSERSQRLWDEMVPVPTRKVSMRLTVTYAGFEGESELLESLYKRGLAGEEIAPDLYQQPNLLMYWTHHCHAPWRCLARADACAATAERVPAVDRKPLGYVGIKLCPDGLVGRLCRRRCDAGTCEAFFAYLDRTRREPETRFDRDRRMHFRG